MGLLDVSDVIRQDGDWSHGYDQAKSSCGFASRALDICDSNEVSTVRGDYTKSPEILKIEPFAVDAVIVRNNRCALPQDQQYLEQTLVEAEEKAIAQVFQDGIMAAWTSPSLSHENVTTLTPPVDAKVDGIVAAALAWFYAVSTEKPIVHLGIGAAFSFSNEAVDVLKELGVEVSISPGYTTGLIAVTGPITIRIGQRQTVEVYDTKTNTTEVQVNEVATIDFDTCGSVAYTPDPVDGYTFSRFEDFAVTIR